MPDHARPVGADDGREKPLVLVVDDLELNVVLLEEKLCAQGFDTIHAFSGRAGWSWRNARCPISCFSM